MRPRIFILLIVIVLTFSFLIKTSQDYSVVAMLVGILLISLDKIFGTSWLINRTAHVGSPSKSQTTRKWWQMISYYGLYEDYLVLIGTGITIAAIVSGIYRDFFGSATTIFAILWNRIADAIFKDCSLFAVVPTIIGAFLAGLTGIFIVLFSKYYEDYRNRKHTYRVLILEVNANQNRLQTHIRNGEEVLKKLEENDANFEIVDFGFDRTVYSAMSDKMGLLDPKIRESVVQYYTKIKDVGDEVRTCNKDYPSHYSLRSIKELRRLALKRSIENAKEANSIGEGLIKNLNAQI